jgi:hypothetical protein
VLYSGSRWYYSTLWPSDVHFLLFSREAPFHSFWNGLFEYATWAFSEITDSGTPVGVTTWTRASSSVSKGDYGYFSATYPFDLLCRCPETSCEGLPELHCGISGSCSNGTCECTDCFGGRYCEYDPWEPYAAPAWAPELTALNTYSVQFWGDPNTCPGVNFALYPA